MYIYTIYARARFVLQSEPEPHKYFPCKLAIDYHFIRFTPMFNLIAAQLTITAQFVDIDQSCHIWWKNPPPLPMITTSPMPIHLTWILLILQCDAHQAILHELAEAEGGHCHQRHCIQHAVLWYVGRSGLVGVFFKTRIIYSDPNPNALYFTYCQGCTIRPNIMVDATLS